MSDNIRIRKAEGTWVVRAGDAVVAETSQALELSEEGHAPVIYFPRADVAMALLDPSPKVTTCPWKGEASHFSVVTPGATLADAAWSYENPKDAVARIRGHLAFYPGKAVVERV